MQAIIPRPADHDDWPGDFDECPACSALSWHIPTQRCTNGCNDDVKALAFVLANMEPDLLAPVLPGEAWADVIARREAAQDILDELLAEFDGEVAA